jgi:hypothetical protein
MDRHETALQGAKTTFLRTTLEHIIYKVHRPSIVEARP